MRIALIILLQLSLLRAAFAGPELDRLRAADEGAAERVFDGRPLGVGDAPLRTSLSAQTSPRAAQADLEGSPHREVDDCDWDDCKGLHPKHGLIGAAIAGLLCLLLFGPLGLVAMPAGFIAGAMPDR